MSAFKKNRNQITSLIMALLVTSGAVFIPGCGKAPVATSSNFEKTTVTYASENTSNAEADYAEDESYLEEEDYSLQSADNSLQSEEYDFQEVSTYPEVLDEATSLMEDMISRDAYYETENDLGTLEKLDYAPIPVDIENFCDASAIEYAEKHNCKDHLLWLADYVVNIVEPQAVEKLLQIPVFKEAAENGEISKYISIYLTYNDVNAFGAMEESCYLGRDGHGVAEWDSPFYYIGHRVQVNLESFPLGTSDQPETMRFLESAMIHEMMHAFVTDYIFNLALGTGPDGARVLERDENGKIIMDEYDRPKHVDEMPTWLQEGLAMTVENPYSRNCEELRALFSPDTSGDDYLKLLTTPESLYNLINKEYDGFDPVNIALITDDENTYGTGWVATLFLCAMEGEQLGYEVFDENGYLNRDAVFYGLNNLLSEIHDGHSLDSVIAEISFDPVKGRSDYEDTTDFEEKCFSSVDDPGLIFMQKLLFDFEARSCIDPEAYMPSGSVLPGLENGVTYCMDSFYHNPSIVYEVDNIQDNNPYGNYFSLSTIPMAKVALGGGRRTSYDPILSPLTPEEEAERNHGYLGDEKKYIDLSLEEE
ncbi:hypothetical protein [Butyrivibrio sp. JL13D10]|uniref:hypothetical protein n=1 Tax=Butyrivibrio sp. JL13D10 TaxID=3236815 RepID=UPI0038B4AFEB